MGTVNGCEYTCCIRLLSIISMLLVSSPRLNPGIPCEYYGVPRPIHMALTVINLFHRAGIVSTPCLKLTSMAYRSYNAPRGLITPDTMNSRS